MILLVEFGIIMKKSDIVESILSELHKCVLDMMTGDEVKAKKADARFLSLSAGLYQFLKSL